MKAQKEKPTIHNRSVPFNTEAEIYVLGSVFIDNNIINSLLGKIDDTDFYDKRNVMTYKAMKNVHASGVLIDVLTVVEELKRLNYEDVDNMIPYLTSMIDSVPSTASVHLYLDIVEENAIERRLLDTLSLLENDILDHKYELNEVLDKTEDMVMQVVKQRRSSQFTTLAKAATDVLNKISELRNNNSDLTGLDTGYPNLNKTTLGLQKGDLIILAARPSVGKSAYAINLAMQTAKLNNAHVAFFSLEMSIEQLVLRIYSYQSQISLSKIRNGNMNEDELLLLKLAEEDLKKLNLYFDESSSSNIADIRTKCRLLRQQDKLDLIIIDYLQLITSQTSRGNRQEEVSIISRQLKTLAQELNVPIIALSQLSRQVDSREDKEPVLSDLRESGTIEQDADIVMFLYRRSDVEEQGEYEDIRDLLQEKLERADNPQKSNDEMKQVILSISKNRQGRLEKYDYNFYGHICRFKEQAKFREIVKKKKKQPRLTKLN